MDDHREDNYKIDMALKDLDKVKELAHRLEKEQAVMDHKIKSLEAYLTDKFDSILESIKSLAHRIEQGMHNPLRQPPDPESLREFISKHSTTIQLAFITIILFINPEVIKGFIINHLGGSLMRGGI